METCRRNIICDSKPTQNGKKVEMIFNVGHKAALRRHPTVEGFTHDWIIFVTGENGKSLENLVEKVEFLLHPTFHNPKRTFRKAPYQVIESGYGGFSLPIDIFLKGVGEPRKVRIMYTLYLGVTPHVTHLRKEVVSFINPGEDLYWRIISSGGVDLGLGFVEKMKTSPQVKRSSSDREENLNWKPKKQEKSNSPKRLKRGRPKIVQNIHYLTNQNQNILFKQLVDNQDEGKMENNSMNNFLTSTPIKNSFHLQEHPKTKPKLKYRPVSKNYSDEEEDEKIIVEEDFHKSIEKYKKVKYEDKEVEAELHELQRMTSMLKSIHNALIASKDKKILKKIVKIIEKTGKYTINKETFDFDLCDLDMNTIQLIHSIL